MPLSGKVAVVTGASGGIGAAIADTLASAGARVVLGARRVDELEKVKCRIEAKVGNDRVLSFKVDVTKRDEVKALVAAAEASFGPVDIMVNNAGEHIPRLYYSNQAIVCCGSVIVSGIIRYVFKYRVLFCLPTYEYECNNSSSSKPMHTRT